MRLTPKLSNKSVVTRNPAYAYRTVNGKTYLTNGSIQCHLNASASFVWELLKQSITTGELVNTLAAQYHLSKKRAQKDLYLLIKTLFQAGLVYIDGKTCTEKVLDTSKPKMNFSELQMKMVKEVIKERTLIKLTLELTYSCSLHCRYCYASAVSGNMMTLEEIEDLLEQAADMGVLYLTLTGGEPLTRPDLIEIVKKAEDLGFWTRIQSGGGSFRKDIVEGLSCFRHVSFSVTLHGADATTHYSFTRVPGSFEKAIKGVQLLVQNGVPVTIKQVITKHNVNQTAKLADLAKDLGV
ncbi:MAG: PqqD family peptide modification chaperone, partial [Thermotogae bacterium]|nr:PqqD family peptide modification chaperone [Thermotogota bacterium]